MAVSAANCVVGVGGTVLWGTTNTTLPTAANSVTTGFTDLGYLDEDGFSVSVSSSFTDFNVWQSRTPVRRESVGQEISVSGKFAEWNANTVPRVFGGGALTTGTYAYPSSETQLEEFALVAHVTDGSVRHRFVFARVNQTEAVETQFNRSNLAVLPFNFKVLAPAGGGSPGAYYTG